MANEQEVQGRQNAPSDLVTDLLATKAHSFVVLARHYGATDARIVQYVQEALDDD